MYPSQYKLLLKALREGDQIPLKELVNFFAAIRQEIEANRDKAHIITDEDPDISRLNYNLAREIVAQSIEHPGFIQIGYEIYDSIDDCADLLKDLDEVDRLSQYQNPGDVWWQYIFSYDSHFNDHMIALEEQYQYLQGEN